MVNNKAFVCFCVDGQSDIDALQVPFSDLFDEIGGDDINVTFRYAEFQGENHGDITSLRNVDPSNIEKMIYKYYFKQQDKKSELGWGDLTYIIHIIDLDGAYVADDLIKEYTVEETNLANRLITKGKAKDILYMDDHIAVRPESDRSKPPSVIKIKDRNYRKRKNIEHLLSIDEITIGKKTVKYILYYFSSNLDHYLYGDANLTGTDKMRRATEFGKIVYDAESLMNFFENSEFNTEGDYKSSWKALRKGNTSITRGTNINLLIDSIKNSTVEYWM